jgi:hypothetical protein
MSCARKAPQEEGQVLEFLDQRKEATGVDPSGLNRHRHTAPREDRIANTVDRRQSHGQRGNKRPGADSPGQSPLWVANTRLRIGGAAAITTRESKEGSTV